MFGLAIVGEFLFKPLDVRAEDQRLRITHFINRPADFIAEGRYCAVRSNSFTLMGFLGKRARGTYHGGTEARRPTLLIQYFYA